MQADVHPLEDLRAEIDRIDREMVGLLIRRTEVVREIAKVKGDREQDRLAVRPAREAAVLRRLVGQSGGRFPAVPLIRIWRELIGTLTQMQTPLSVAVYAPREGAPTWDLARDHFGSAATLLRVESASQAIRAAGNGVATVAVLPLPTDEDRWWPTLMSDQFDRIRVFARMPFVRRPEGEGEDPAAIAIGRVELEASGDDQSLLAI
jgi:chorismate mutase/prephenate dehydratase